MFRKLSKQGNQQLSSQPGSQQQHVGGSSIAQTQHQHRQGFAPPQNQHLFQGSIAGSKQQTAPSRQAFPPPSPPQPASNHHHQQQQGRMPNIPQQQMYSLGQPMLTNINHQQAQPPQFPVSNQEPSQRSHQNLHTSFTGQRVPVVGSDVNDPRFTPHELSRPNPNYPQPPHASQNQPSTPVPYGENFTSVGNDFYLHVDPLVRELGTPNFKLSNCQGRKKALLIGINYFNTSAQLNGCINDVKNIKEFIITLYNFKEQDMIILTDDQPANSKFYPTRANIIAAMQWLVSDSKPNDSFFFHYSGHGGRVVDSSGDEDDGYDETIYPVDHDKYKGESGQIIDDLMHDIMVKPLVEGCRLTCIFDSCHSGTALDLPYVYSTKGMLKEKNVLKGAGKGLLSAGISYATGNKARALSSLIELRNTAKSQKEIQEWNRQNLFSPADVIMFSGCKDIQTSADAVEDGKATGAMSYAFTTTLRQDPKQSYHALLNSIRDILREKYSQRPQMSASHPIDVNLQFVC
ncbi:hypothetical protein HMPREF1544_03174 [Mucor circinelloides 1006PhL]|uniref:Peptidase C14 caspase domain-containing protein n=1 Tax=Mucor circinelloides f. circinelloides (strain 1006PhL) TaxID=1220926 RepID=S2JI00_MUCC1|nr:hypothetical protein HMPREF1544_03174 [Mucor circinelloides 1006PhL]